MRCQINVVRFTPTGNLLCFCNPANNTEVNPCILHQFLLNQFSEFPLRGDVLGNESASNLYIYMYMYYPHRSGDTPKFPRNALVSLSLHYSSLLAEMVAKRRANHIRKGIKWCTSRLTRSDIPSTPGHPGSPPVSHDTF